MTNQQGAPEALRHADGLESFAQMLPAYGFDPQPLKDAAATVRSLHALALELADQLSGKNERLAALVEAQQTAPSAAAAIAGEIELIEKAVRRVGITSLLNHGAGSCVFTEGCEGVSQDHLLAYTREIALHCAVALGAHPAVDDMAKELDAARDSLQWHMRRCEQLQRVQHRMRDPERTMVCDILANGSLLVPEGQRYTAPQPAPTPQADSQPAPVADSCTDPYNCKRCMTHPNHRGGMEHAGIPAHAVARAARAPADSEVARLRAALVYTAYALHATPQYMLAEGITLIDGDTVRVSRDGWTVEAGVNPARATPPTKAADSVLEDAARLDWLDQNIFHREMSEWDAKFGGRCNQNMWVLFAPKGVQGSSRNIIDAARKQEGAT